MASEQERLTARLARIAEEEATEAGASAVAVAPTRFDYSIVTPDIAEALRRQAERVRLRLTKATADMIETGRDLVAAKEQLKHGDFTRWVEEAIGIRIRAAQEFMRMAEIAEGESANFALLPPYAATRLAAPSVPPQSRAAFVQRAEAGDRVTVVEVDRELGRLRQEREEAKKAAALAKLSPRSRKSREEKARLREEQYEASQKKREDDERRATQGAEELALILHNRLSPDEWRRVRELLGDFEVVMPKYSCGVQEFRVVEAMKALEEPSGEYPARTVAGMVANRIGEGNLAAAADLLEAAQPESLAAACLAEMEATAPSTHVAPAGADDDIPDFLKRGRAA